MCSAKGGIWSEPLPSGNCRLIETRMAGLGARGRHRLYGKRDLSRWSDWNDESTSQSINCVYSLDTTRA